MKTESEGAAELDQLKNRTSKLLLALVLGAVVAVAADCVVEAHKDRETHKEMVVRQMGTCTAHGLRVHEELTVELVNEAFGKCYHMYGLPDLGQDSLEGIKSRINSIRNQD